MTACSSTSSPVSGYSTIARASMVVALEWPNGFEDGEMTIPQMVTRSSKLHWARKPKLRS